MAGTSSGRPSERRSPSSTATAASLPAPSSLSRCLIALVIRLDPPLRIQAGEVFGAVAQLLQRLAQIVQFLGRAVLDAAAPLVGAAAHPVQQRRRQLAERTLELAMRPWRCGPARPARSRRRRRARRRSARVGAARPRPPGARRGGVARPGRAARPSRAGRVRPRPPSEHLGAEHVPIAGLPNTRPSRFSSSPNCVRMRLEVAGRTGPARCAAA